MIDLRQRDNDAVMKLPEKIWEVLLSVASKRDWKPIGPDIPGQRRNDDPFRYEDKDWRDDYFAPEGQYIVQEDAKELAAALERFLPEIPDEDGVGSDAEEHTQLAELPVTPFELFQGDGKQLVRDFIDFCRKGGFFVRG